MGKKKIDPEMKKIADRILSGLSADIMDAVTHEIEVSRSHEFDNGYLDISIKWKNKREGKNGKRN